MLKQFIKRKAIVASVTTALTLAPVAQANKSELTVHVTNIDTSRPGDIVLMIFNETGFPKQHDKAIYSLATPADKTQLRFHLELELPVFAVKVLHDEIGDRKVTKNWTGIIPSEGLGFSNGATLSWRGAPTFKNAAIVRDSQTLSLTIPVIYP
ncbi:MAG: DUF2141 domain-containing protein [Pseudoalteromonas spongiae]